MELMSWWADRCRFDCRVDLVNGLFTDQRWMDLAPGFVDSLAMPPRAGPEPRLLEPRGPHAGRGKDGWTVDGQPLALLPLLRLRSGRGRRSSASTRTASRAARLAAARSCWPTIAEAMLRNGHETSRAIAYAHADFPSGRPVTAAMRRRALRAARDGRGLQRLGSPTRSRPGSTRPTRRRSPNPACPTSPDPGAGLARRPRHRPFDMTSRGGPPGLPPVVRRATPGAGRRRPGRGGRPEAGQARRRQRARAPRPRLARQAPGPDRRRAS